MHDYRPKTFYGAIHTGMIQLDRNLENEGHWVTINGAHVLIKDGHVVAGPAHLMGRHESEITGKNASRLDKVDIAKRNLQGHISGERKLSPLDVAMNRQVLGKDHPIVKDHKKKFDVAPSSIVKDAIRGKQIPDEVLDKARGELGDNHPFNEEYRRANLPQFVDSKTRADRLNDYKQAISEGSEVAKPKHGSERGGYRSDYQQKQFERFLDSEYEKEHGVIDEDELRPKPTAEADQEHEKDSAGSRVTRKSIESRLMEHHQQYGAHDAETTYEETDKHGEYSNVASIANRTFRVDADGNFPGEVRKMLNGRSHLSLLLRKTTSGKAGGHDTMANLGADKYEEALSRLSEGEMSKAIKTAKASGDPEMQLLAAIHEKRNTEGSNTQLIHFPIEKLQPGHSFKINGDQFEVDEDEDGKKVIHSPHGYPEIPTDGYYSHIPFDKGSLMKKKPTEYQHAKDDIPFSREWLNERLMINLSQGNLFGSSGVGAAGGLFDKKPAAKSDSGDGHWVTIHGMHILIKHGESIRKALSDHFKGSKPITAEHIDHAAKQIEDKGGTANRDHADVDNNRQLGLIPDEKGNHPEIGAKPGQASLFGNDTKPTPKATTEEKPKFDPSATGKMFDNEMSFSDPDVALMIKSVKQDAAKLGERFYVGKKNRKVFASNKREQHHTHVVYPDGGVAEIGFDIKSTNLSRIIALSIAKNDTPKDGFADLCKKVDPVGYDNAFNKSVHLSAIGEVIYLSATCTERDAVTLGQGLPKTINELPIHYKWMDAAYAGQWKHPTKNIDVPINEKRIDQWVSNIKLSRSRGVNLPACKDHKETADNSLGEIFDARRNGERLELLIGYKGDDALKVAQRNYLSIGIDPDFKDSRGNKYGESIRHVAITPVPVIHGQTGFIN